MERILFRNWSGQQTRPPEELTMDACRSSRFAPKRKGVDARLFLLLKASTQVSESADIAVPGQSAAATARPAVPAPARASADLLPCADDRG